MTIPLPPHQHQALVAELSRPEYAGLSADQAFARFAPVPRPRRRNPSEQSLRAASALKRLASTRFLTVEEWDGLREKDREQLENSEAPVLVCAEGELGAHPPRGVMPRDVPGFPNKVRREWFDAAWAEATGDV